jgi:hypothetical protein
LHRVAIGATLRGTVLDYGQVMQQHRDGSPESAAAPVLYAGRKPGCGCKKRGLTGASEKASTVPATVSWGKRRTKRARKGASTQREDSRMATAKQKAAARKNIKKAQAALKRKRGGTKTTRKAEKRSKKKGGAKKGHSSAKQRAAARKNIKKAQAANRRKGKSHTKAPRKHAKRAEAKRPRKKSGGKKKGGGRKSGKRKGGKRKGSHRKGTRSAHRTSSTHTTRTEIIKMPGHTTKVAILPIQTGGHRRKSGKRKSGKRKSGKKKGGKKGKGRSRARETGYAMENPLSGVEIFVGGLTGLLGFGVADVLDRYLATHALGGTTGAYTDTPPTSGTYNGLYNATAVIAPMGWLRWGVGLGLTAVPLVAARWVKAPVGRSALQFFGFGVGFRVVGKGLQTLFAYAFKNASFGQRLYDAEVRAYYLKANAGTIPSTVSLPSSGLGEVPELGCGKCANCITGVGACCGKGRNGPTPTSSMAPPPPPPPPPPQTQPTWVPSPPPPTQTPSTTTYNPPRNRPQIPVTSTLPGGTRTYGGTQGVPSERRSKFQWGSDSN